MRVFQVLVYHRVCPNADGVFDGVSPGVLQKKLRVLQLGFDIVSVGKILEGGGAGGWSPRKPAIGVTLDDGYSDNYLFGFPLFKRLDIKPLIFLTTGPLETGEPLWHDKMFTAFARTRKERWGVNGNDYDFQTPQGRAAASEAFASYVRRLPERERDDAIEALCRELGVSPDEAANRTPMLTWDEVAEMAEWGVEFGAHTVTHPILSTLPPERQEEEIRGSIETIERRLGIRPTLFAYPNGRPEDFNEDTEAILAKHGVKAAFTTVRGVNRPETPRYRLHRGAGWSQNPYRFVAQTLWYRFSG
ncbi:polysaccharide deacetylase family protein [Deferrisoma palaeochoriense]